MPYDYPPQVANSSRLSNQGQAFSHFKNHLKRQSQKSIAIWYSLKTFLELHNVKHAYTKYICIHKHTQIVFYCRIID